MSATPPSDSFGFLAQFIPAGLTADQLYSELKLVAIAYLAREDAGHTLQPTALVHEALIRLAREANRESSGKRPTWRDGKEFLRLAVVAMQRILIEHARRKMALRRGGQGGGAAAGVVRTRLPLELLQERADGRQATSDELERLEVVLDRFEQVDPRAATVVRFRFFGGLTSAEAARALEISPSTAEEDWRIARAWIGRAMGWRSA